MSIFSVLKRLFDRGKDPPGCSVVIAAAGSSQRMCGDDKLYLNINGAPVLAHTLIAFQRNTGVSEIIVVSREECFELVSGICKKHGITKALRIMKGGDTRLDSVMNGVFAVSKNAKLIAIHDGARPCIDPGIIDATIAAAEKHNAAAPAISVIPTLKKVRDGVIVETVDRQELFEIQTPQIFDADIIKAALTKVKKENIDVTDDCMAVELLGFPIHVTEGSSSNIKLTTSDDLILADAILSNRGVIADVES